MLSMVMSVVSQNDRMSRMSVEEAGELVASARKAALTLFPARSWPTI